MRKRGKVRVLRHGDSRAEEEGCKGGCKGFTKGQVEFINSTWWVFPSFIIRLTSLLRKH
jgi:hypothetical protein